MAKVKIKKWHVKAECSLNTKRIAGNVKNKLEAVGKKHTTTDVFDFLAEYYENSIIK